MNPPKARACHRKDQWRLSVPVGSVEHPMAPEHYIEWIELITDTQVMRKYLKPGEKPVAVFMTDATDVAAREYCVIRSRTLEI